MKVFIKQILGSEHSVEVSPTDTVLQLKNKISELVGLEAQQQTLLLIGKPLSDDNQISSYPQIKDGCKLVLVKKVSSQSNSRNGVQKFRDELLKVLRRFYSEQNAQTVANETIKVLKNKANLLSYDDLERLATALLADTGSP